ncbi:MAG: SMP-30/gluconolactonase/LRE family protein [Chloroflexi bacterium]|nr:SMP-30/gluconolactonase/LRE family protein [Chloroflexota bacterium]
MRAALQRRRTTMAAFGMVLAVAFAAFGVLATQTPVSAKQHRPMGDSEVFAKVPAPGYPEGIAVEGNRVYVSGPASFGITDPAKVWAYNRKTGALEATYPITISSPAVPFRGLSCIAFGPDGKLYAIEPFVGVIRMSLDHHNTQELYSAFPPPPASGALPNDLAFDKHGNLFVTDSFQGLVYRIPAGGGAPQVWFQDARLLGNPQLPFGVNGIRIDKKDKDVYLNVTVRADFSGAVYRLPLKANPTAADLTEFHVYPATQFGPPAPDGLAFGKSGLLYVALAGSSQISVLRPNGTEATVYSGPAKVPGTANTLPWANPANIAFNDKEGTLLVTNHASLVPYDPNLFAVFDVMVDDKAEPLP